MKKPLLNQDEREIIILECLHSDILKLRLAFAHFIREIKRTNKKIIKTYLIKIPDIFN